MHSDSGDLQWGLSFALPASSDVMLLVYRPNWIARFERTCSPLEINLKINHLSLLPPPSLVELIDPFFFCAPAVTWSNIYKGACNSSFHLHVYVPADWCIISSMTRTMSYLFASKLYCSGRNIVSTKQLCPSALTSHQAVSRRVCACVSPLRS